MISIAGLQSLVDALAHPNFSSAQQAVLEQAAQKIEIAVVESLSHYPGEDHTTPWLRTGSLRASIAHSSDENGAAVGSDDPTAVYQELGTRSIPPRPFFAPAAAVQAPAAAQEIADAVAGVLAGALE